MPSVDPPPCAFPVRETVLCLHASATPARAWGPIAAALGHAFVVQTPDRLGSGAAPWPRGAAASLDEEARHLAPLLAAAPGGAHLLAHSYGAAVALQVALRWPSRVRSLTLFEPARFGVLTGPLCADAAAEIRDVAAGVRRALDEGREDRAAGAFVDYWSGAGAWQALDPARRAAVARQMSKVDAEFDAAFADRLPLRAYADLAMPVWLLHGTRSPRPARRVVERLAVALPHARVVPVAGVGHMAPVVQPADVLGHLPPWLGGGVSLAA